MPQQQERRAENHFWEQVSNTSNISGTNGSKLLLKQKGMVLGICLRENERK